MIRMSYYRRYDASMDQISTTLVSVLSEYFKSSERTVFWDDEKNANVDPFEGMAGGFFATDWDFKVGFCHLFELPQHRPLLTLMTPKAKTNYS
jgi:hypothetical protein